MLRIDDIYTSGEYANKNPTWGGKDAPWKADKVKSMLERLDLRPEALCDIGCGTGAVLRCMREWYPAADLVGYELSPQAIALGSDTASGVTLIQGGAMDFPETFEVALCLDVMEHVEDYIGFVRSIRQKASIIIFHIPLDMSVQTVARMRPLLRSRETVGHLHYFSRETALATLKLAGYEVVAEKFTTGSPDFRGSLLRKRAGAFCRSTAARISPATAARVLGGFSLLVAARAKPGPSS